MIKVSEIYNDVALDNVNKDENGNLSFTMFNRLSKRAELRIMDYLTGDVEGLKPPIPYLTQKNKDWLAPFIVPLPATHIQDGKLEVPKDYYAYENMSRLDAPECNEKASDALKSGCSTQIVLLDGQQFNSRCKSHIKGLRPSDGEPIAKMVGNLIIFQPKEVGDVVLEYIRYPKFAFVRTKFDPQFHDEVVDEEASQDYEWPEAIRELLVWTITDLFSVHNREQALKNANTLTGKTEGQRR